jgi:uncharacterized protein YkwD
MRKTYVKILQMALAVAVILALAIGAIYLARFKYELFNLSPKTATGFGQTPVDIIKQLQEEITEKILPNDALNSYFVEQYINDERAKTGLTQLRHSTELTESSQAKLNDMITVNYFAHTSPSGLTPWDFITNAHYNYQVAGENLATGNYTNEHDVVEAWMNSPEHKAVALNPKFCDIGISIARAKQFMGSTNIYVVVMHAGVRTTSSLDSCKTN